ncbi:Uncharacterised protein [Vibrio cholerae]|nr:Uncharacterised protein [Vibrio cholerae]
MAELEHCIVYEDDPVLTVIPQGFCWWPKNARHCATYKLSFARKRCRSTTTL